MNYIKGAITFVCICWLVYIIDQLVKTYLTINAFTGLIVGVCLILFGYILGKNVNQVRVWLRTKLNL